MRHSLKDARDATGLGMMATKKAQDKLGEGFDLVLAAFYAEADMLAINVKGGPEARHKWNLERARKKFKEYICEKQKADAEG